MSLSFVMVNSQENFDLLQETGKAWFLGWETNTQVEVCFDDPEECARARHEVGERSSLFQDLDA